MCSHTTSRFWWGSRGFSLIEALMAALITCILGGILLLNVRGLKPRMDADAAGTQVKNVLRQARDLAVSQRRSIQVEFLNPNQIRLTRINPSLPNTVLLTETLVNNAQFRLYSGLPDSPDAFGNSQAVSFPATTSMNFLPDGTFVNAAGNPINGSVFLGSEANEASTARAVTILGATGRLQLYRWETPVSTWKK